MTRRRLTQILMTPNRRFRAARAAFLTSTLLAVAACDPDSATPPQTEDPAATSGRLSARYAPRTEAVPTGLSVQKMTPTGRQFGLYVPSNYDPGRAWPVALLLHGLGGSGEGMALEFQAFAEDAGLVVIAPNSYSVTWDLLYSASRGSGRFGVDRTYIDNLLKWTFDHVAVDPDRISIGGFAEGGTYALWLGLKNGDLFSRVAAFSPCSNVPNTRTGLPLVFISHGADDQVSPIETCSRVMVPRLETAGYEVDFVEYPSNSGDGHFMTPDIKAQGMVFLAGE